MNIIVLMENAKKYFSDNPDTDRYQVTIEKCSVTVFHHKNEYWFYSPHNRSSDYLYQYGIDNNMKVTRFTQSDVALWF